MGRGRRGLLEDVLHCADHAASNASDVGNIAELECTALVSGIGTGEDVLEVTVAKMA